ncbi:MAG: lipopolysaccharide biosynthesis protein [Burkholderiales bacterium]|nr:lipopolysaccharide biosynthesis protein [Burkholderiales bacterium]
MTKPSLARRDRLRAGFFPSSLDLKRRVVRGASFTFLGTALRVLLTIGSTAVLARLLTPEDYGLVGLASIVTELTAALTNVGLSAILIQRSRLARVQCDTVFWFSMALGGGISLVLVAGAPLFAQLLGDPRVAPLLRVLPIMFLLEQMTIIQHVTMMRLMMFDLDLRVQVTALLFRIGVSIGFAVYGWGPWALVAGSIGGKLFEIAYMWWAIPYLPRLRFQRSFMRSNLRASASILSLGGVRYIMGNVDFMIVGRVFGATDLGHYQAAYTLSAELRNRLAGPLQKVLYPAYARVRDEPERFRRGVRTSLKLLSAVVVPLGFGMSATAQELIPILYGPQWLAAVPMLQALGIAGALMAIFSLTGSVMSALRKWELMLKITLYGSPVRITIILAGSYWGPVGVAWAFTIAQFSGFVAGSIATRLCGMTLREYAGTLWPALVSGALMMLAVTLLRPHLLELELPVRFAALVIAGAALYAGSIGLLWPQGIREVKDIAGGFLRRD